MRLGNMSLKRTIFISESRVTRAKLKPLGGCVERNQIRSLLYFCIFVRAAADPPGLYLHGGPSKKPFRVKSWDHGPHARFMYRGLFTLNMYKADFSELFCERSGYINSPLFNAELFIFKSSALSDIFCLSSLTFSSLSSWIWWKSTLFALWPRITTQEPRTICTTNKRYYFIHRQIPFVNTDISAKTLRSQNNWIGIDIKIMQKNERKYNRLSFERNIYYF